MKRILFLILLMCSSNYMLANTAWQQANNLYKNKQYQQAFDAYQALVNKGYINGELYYNAGNAAYKNKQRGWAILYYEKAIKNGYCNDEIQKNLQIANLHIVDRISKIPELGIVSFWKNIVANHSSSSWGWVAILCGWLLAICIAVFIYLPQFKRISFYGGIIVLLMGLICYLIANQIKNYQVNIVKAVVVKSNTTVKSAPEQSSTDVFVIHDGLKVEVIDNVSPYSKIKLIDGKMGWCLTSDIAII